MRKCRFRDSPATAPVPRVTGVVSGEWPGPWWRAQSSRRRRLDRAYHRSSPDASGSGGRGPPGRSQVVQRRSLGIDSHRRTSGHPLGTASSRLDQLQ